MAKSGQSSSHNSHPPHASIFFTEATHPCGDDLDSISSSTRFGQRFTQMLHLLPSLLSSLALHHSSLISIRIFPPGISLLIALSLRTSFQNGFYPKLSQYPYSK